MEGCNTHPDSPINTAETTTARAALAQRDAAAEEVKGEPILQRVLFLHPHIFPAFPWSLRCRSNVAVHLARLARLTRLACDGCEFTRFVAVSSQKKSNGSGPGILPLIGGKKR